VRIRFIAAMPKSHYSGGRLLALTLAESLAMNGADVDFVTDNVPFMYEEFRPFSRIRLITTTFDNLSPHVVRDLDFVIIVPHQGQIEVHSEFLRHAIECNAQIGLLNFESPNWFNSVSPFKRDPAIWAGWDLISGYADLILSISREGQTYAREYYRGCKSACRFRYCYPAINSVLADKAKDSSVRQNRIMCLTRLDPHKGFVDLEPLATRELAGFSIDVFMGNGEIPSDVVRKLRASFAKLDIEFATHGPIVGIEKFEWLKSSAALYFPTRFEGFGIPPLEAAYCGTPVACSDLPVLREFGETAFFYAMPSNHGAMQLAALNAVRSGSIDADNRQRFTKLGDMANCGSRLSQALAE
jgi:glycosyltransferase involved in cell wall biosynthesis